MAVTVVIFLNHRHLREVCTSSLPPGCHSLVNALTSAEVTERAPINTNISAAYAPLPSPCTAHPARAAPCNVAGLRLQGARLCLVPCVKNTAACKMKRIMHVVDTRVRRSTRTHTRACVLVCKRARWCFCGWVLACGTFLGAYEQGTPTRSPCLLM